MTQPVDPQPNDSNSERRLTDRPTTEIIILMFTVTVCLSLIASGISLTVFVFVKPEYDVTNSIDRLYQTIDIMVGALLGFTTGRAVKGASDNSPDPPP
jgi:uncharacterized membrane protein HdeD (DUF308 family)